MKGATKMTFESMHARDIMGELVLVEELEEFISERFSRITAGE